MKDRKNKSWKRHEIDTLLNLRDNHKSSYNKIANVLGRTTAACQSKYSSVTRSNYITEKKAPVMKADEDKVLYKPDTRITIKTNTGDVVIYPGTKCDTFVNNEGVTIKLK